MDRIDRFVLFVVEDQKYALPLHVVDRVVRAVEVTPLPDAPRVVAGVFNMQGKIVPVIDLRRRFHLPERPIDPDDHFVVAQAPEMLVAFPVDEALGLAQDLSGERTPAADVVPDLNYVDSVVPDGGDMIFVLDIERVLSDDEQQALSENLPSPSDAS